ncbi:MAG: Y-family DNA polymerase [Chitinophagaceae bacterium]|nr:MAG: Y-family DNA polymerase [Chitinophagaceae bacterium]
MYAIVDCNSFYCSCERVFKPEYQGRPVVVLSNNDGCIISRSDEAKNLGVEMAGPYFLAKNLIERNNVGLFSSNYNLYGDMSRRVMDTLKHLAGEQNVEVYSVDEAFVNLFFLPQDKLRQLAMEMRHTVEKWTGVAVSVGVAPTKTLAKLANNIAKKNKERTECVAVLETDEKIAKALMMTPVGDLWGIGRRSAKKLMELGIHTGWDLRQMPEEWARKNLGGVVGVRLIQELQGQEAIVMDEYKDKKMIATTRMFGAAVTELTDIKEAIATYTARAAEKLRRQYSAAGMINVFVVTNEKEASEEVVPNYRHGATYSTHIILDYPTSQTHELIKAAVALAQQLYQQGKQYKKAGVMLGHIVPDDSIQGNLFNEQKSIGRFLMEQIDNINFSMRGDVVKFASSGTKRDWKMRQDFQTPRYTTRWEELCEVR